VTGSVRLYSWVDVEQILRDHASRGSWPTGLLEASAWWDGVELSTAELSEQNVLEWLADVFGPLYDVTDRNLRLETGDRLRVIVESDAPEPRPRRPRLRAPRITQALATALPAPTEALSGAPVASFHSFKGGVGRTLHALATASALSKHTPVLLVDGDLEAPGISWTLSDRLPDPVVAYADLLALVQGAGDDAASLTDVVELVGTGLLNQNLDGVFVLPASRSGSPADIFVSPADLVNADADPYRLSSVLSRLAAQIGARVAIVDLRAGFSELSAGLLLDPRIFRVFVTSLSHQSLAGTELLLASICANAPSARDYDPLPAAVVSLVPDGVDYTSAVESLNASLAPFGRHVDGEPERELDAPIIVSPLRQEWLVLPPSWDAVMARVATDDVHALLGPLVDWLAVTDVSGPVSPSGWDIQQVRDRLADKAASLVYAETSLSAAEGTSFMPTTALTRLAGDHKTEVPNTVVVGAKGAGKTFTYLNLALAGTWANFANAALAGSVALNAQIVPALGPKNIAVDVENKLRAARQAAREHDESNDAVPSLLLHERLEEALQNPPGGPGAWRRFWLDLLMTSLGVNGTVGDAESRVQALGSRHIKLIFVLDGLEEAFLDFASNEVQQAAIRALLQDVPAWLQLVEGRPAGVVVFAREDIVRAVLPQNAGQLLQRHRAYALHWGDDEVLRLALWVAAQANSLPGWRAEEIRSKSPDEVEEALTLLWGRKMGSARSREARSTPWVLAALSDFRPQIQARDLVNFLEESAQRSSGEGATDRILTPTAMRAALVRCSADKLRAIAEEDPRLASVFNELRDQPAELKRMPFSPTDLELSSAALELLVTTGAAMRINDVYWMPEIYRHGLGFQTATARPRVIQLANRARR
jgi:hypothetical protein